MTTIGSPMGYKADIIEDSISPGDIRLTTIHLRYPRFIHAELMTHRVFSRNARSSRAVPVQTLLNETPYIPWFMENRPGMQALDDMQPADRLEAERIWGNLIQITRDAVESLMELGVHKQWANRPLEWFGWIDVLVTATDWGNFFLLRDHKDAMPEIGYLARLMRRSMDASKPKLLYPGEWHLPYVDEPPRLGDDDARCKISAARCARISYKPFGEAKPDLIKDFDLFMKLMGSSPVHASPAEHQATPDEIVMADIGSLHQQHPVYLKPELHGNFRGWVQFRKTLPNEALREA